MAIDDEVLGRRYYEVFPRQTQFPCEHRALHPGGRDPRVTRCNEVAEFVVATDTAATARVTKVCQRCLPLVFEQLKTGVAVVVERFYRVR